MKPHFDLKKLDAQTLDTLTLAEEETFLQDLVDNLSLNHAQTKELQPTIKIIQNHLKQRKTSMP